MSREIDESDLKKLSKEDLMYLRDRGRLSAEDEEKYLPAEGEEKQTEEETTEEETAAEASRRTRR